MVLDTSLLNTQQYKVCIKGKNGAIQRKGVAPLPYTFGVVAIKKGSLLVALDYSLPNFTLLMMSDFLYFKYEKKTQFWEG